MKKFNIVAINGSNASFSNTFKLTNEILMIVKDKLKSNDIELSGIISTYRDLKLQPCIGCEQCFITGSCPLDKNDLMPLLKERLLNADCIIFSSPVYINHIPGTLKCLIDRLGYWMHLMRLSNKMGFIIVNSSYSGIEETTNYLYNIMTHLGINVRKKYQLILNPKTESNIPITTNNIAKSICSEILKSKKNVNEDLNTVFLSRKSQYTPFILNNISGFEIDYWKERNLNNISSFNEYLDSLT